MGCLLYPEGFVPAQGSVPDQTIEDLQLERLASFMSRSHYYKITAEELCALWSEDSSVIAHRQAVLRDITDNPKLEAALDKLLGCIDGWEGRIGGLRRGLDEMAVGINMESFGYLDSYIQKLDTVYHTLCGISYSSPGMKALFSVLERMHNSERYQQLEEQFQTLCAGYVSPKRMRLAFNLAGDAKPSLLKLLYLEPYTGEEKARGKKRKLQLTQNAVEMNMMLLQRTVQSAAPAITAFVMRETAELRNVKKDLIFFLSAAKLCRSFSDRGLKWCFPESCPPDDKAFTVKNMFNPLLVVSGRETIVPNDIELKKGGEILIMTGANQGGKTVFLMSVGLTQWLYQLGIAVPCEHASLSPVKSIFTVFAPNKSESRQRGLLAEEAGHIAAAVGGIRENCMALFNEPLTSTSPSETKSISLEIIAAFKAAGVRGIWVTHIHELAFMRKKLEQNIPWGSALGSLKIVMDQTGSESTYKITRAEPDFNSHAYDVLRRKGVTLQSGT